jgi:hypothetical protein
MPLNYNPETVQQSHTVHAVHIYAAFGLKTRLAAPVVGQYLLHSLRKEERRLEAGMTLEPHCFYERNETARKENARPIDAKDAPVGLEPVGVRAA